jgi:hypothetical protein
MEERIMFMKNKILFVLFAAVLIIIVVFFFSKKSKGIYDLMLTKNDVDRLKLEEALSFDGKACHTEESLSSPNLQYVICNYTVKDLKDTWIIIELKRFPNKEDLYNNYEYESQHLFRVQGLISENALGDKSRFRVSNENDFGQHNEPGVYYYHLWVCKDDYLIHITSRGGEKAGDRVIEIGRTILSKI